MNRGAGIEIVAYDPQWLTAFDEEAGRLRAALGRLALRIDHHGSTAVPGLAAKPIVDIQVSVASLQPLADYRAPLAGIGYVHVPHADDEFCPFFHRPAEWPHAHHLHVVRAGSDEERRTLAFRDYLRAHDDEARAYEGLKRELAIRLGGADAETREAYARAKTDFVNRIVAAALSQGYALPQAWTVWRQDDNGNVVAISSGHDRGQAGRIAREFEARGHRQTYWTAPDRP